MLKCYFVLFVAAALCVLDWALNLISRFSYMDVFDFSFPDYFVLTFLSAIILLFASSR